ncbi:hypothetical protein [Methanoculleus sp. MH98A]|uniref:hypothetical protein n=1 Tax=Methanoculleus sp. MH98A TaxID=1495314 RepID=UPI00049ED587|nr:hypothetical protein [Methanoculleus sp. MH98A]KDE54555.1 hypothetical protein EI28_13460 [Methanoculleus sp. MH98A]
MSSKKEVTIGITINLENYENLRLEVEGDVETHEDVDDLITFLDGILARVGRGDQATAERVDAYRRRVLAARPAAPAPEKKAAAPEEKAPEPAAPVAEPAPREEEKEKKACPPPEVIAAAIPPAPEHPEPPRTPKPPAKPEEKPAEQPEAAPAEEPAPAKPPEGPAEDVCEVCGAEVTKSQAKLSRLFMSKTLCKKCMEQP